MVVFKRTGKHGCRGCVLNNPDINCMVCYDFNIQYKINCAKDKGIFVIDEKKGEKLDEKS